jgi:hypothetical protein
MSTYNEKASTNGNRQTVVDLEAFDSFTYTDPLEDEMAGTSRTPHDERIADILEQQNQLLMWLKTKEIAGGNEKKSTVTPVLAVIIAALGIVIGLVTSIAITAKWTGDIEARIKAIESQRAEDKQIWEYIRTQNEVNGKVLAGIQATLNNENPKPTKK